jgi:hypothetical protein
MIPAQVGFTARSNRAARKYLNAPRTPHGTHGNSIRQRGPSRAGEQSSPGLGTCNAAQRMNCRPMPVDSRTSAGTWASISRIQVIIISIRTCMNIVMRRRSKKCDILAGAAMRQPAGGRIFSTKYRKANLCSDVPRVAGPSARERHEASEHLMRMIRCVMERVPTSRM